MDNCVSRIVAALKDKGWAALVTADHGNAEKMTAENGSPYTAHTLGQVRCILVDDDRRAVKLRDEGSLCDIAPTILEVMGLSQPEEMTGRSLLK